MKDKIRSVPSLPANVDPTLRPVLQTIIDNISVRMGQTRNTGDVSPTWDDLIGSGAIIKAPGSGNYRVAERDSDATRGSLFAKSEGIPPAITLLEANVGIESVLLRWHGFRIGYVDYIEIWRGPTTNVADATLLGTADGLLYLDVTLEQETQYYYFARAVNAYDGNTYFGPWNLDGAISVYLVETGSQILARLDNLIDLSTRLDLIDEPVTGLIQQALDLAAETSTLATDTAQLAVDLGLANNAISLLQTDGDGNSLALTAIQSDITGLQTDVSGQATAISTLQTDTAGNASAITLAQSDITTLEGDVAGQATAISTLQTDTAGNASAITLVQSDVTALGSTVTGQATAIGTLQTDTAGNASAITALNSTVNHPTTGLAVTASALDTLETTVSGQSTSISALQSTVNNPTTGLAATVTAVNTLETNVNGYSASITALQSTVDNPLTGVNVTASALQTLETIVDGPNGLTSQWSVKTTVGERTGGIGFYNDGNDVVFAVDADVMGLYNNGVLSTAFRIDAGQLTIDGGKVTIADLTVENFTSNQIATMFTNIVENTTSNRVTSTGVIATDIDANSVSIVDTLHIGPDQVTVPKGVAPTGTVTYARPFNARDVVIASTSHNTLGLRTEFKVSGFMASLTDRGLSVQLKIKRAGVVIYQTSYYGFGSSTIDYYGDRVIAARNTVIALLTPSSGTATYTAEVAVSDGIYTAASGDIEFSDVTMTMTTLKR